MIGTLPGDWSGLVVLQAATRWDNVRFADQHLAASLSRHAPVLYVDPPVSPKSLRSSSLPPVPRRPELQLIAPGLARLTPVVLPAPERPGMSTITTRRSRRAVDRAVTSLGASVRCVLGSSTEVLLFGTCGELRRVHWAQDDFLGNPELIGSTTNRVARGEARIAGLVDLVVAANPLVADKWRQRGVPTELVPFGCDDEHFAATDQVAPAADVKLPGPVVGFVGHIGERIDLDLLDAIARRGTSLLLVGPRHPRLAADALSPLLSRPNVQWVGGRDFDELPSYLAAIDVGVVPYLDTPFNRASFPLKQLEYLAAGLGVVSTDLPATRWLDTDLIQIAPRTPDGFADAVDGAIRVPFDRGRCRTAPGLRRPTQLGGAGGGVRPHRGVPDDCPGQGSRRSELTFSDGGSRAGADGGGTAMNGEHLRGYGAAEGARLRRAFGALTACFVLVAVGLPAFEQPAGAAGDPCAPVVSRVACENSKPGDVSPPDSPLDSSIEGFTTDTSVNPGQTVRFKINTTASAYSLDIYRVGWYQGIGTRKMATVTPSASLPQIQPSCLTDIDHRAGRLRELGRVGVVERALGRSLGDLRRVPPPPRDEPR